MRRWLCLWFLALSGCAVSPQPTPPSFTGALTGVVDGDTRRVEGTVSEEAIDAAVLAFNLTTVGPDAVQVAAVAPDGVFDIAFDGDPGDLVRLQLLAEDGLGPPFEAQFLDGELVERDGLPCLLVEPDGELLDAVDVGRPAAGGVTLLNTCDEEVVVDAVEAVEPAPGVFEIAAGALPFDIPAGEEATVFYTVTPDATGLFINALRFQLVAPEAQTVAHTVVVDAI